jgi:hypothetical protein
MNPATATGRSSFGNLIGPAPAAPLIMPTAYSIA